MKILITGGAGFLGAWIAKRLVEGGCEVRIFDRNDDPRLVRAIVGEAGDAIEFRTGDVTSGSDVLAAAEGCASVAHLAALLTPACQADPIRGANVNVNGTLNVFEAARTLGLRSVVYASSAGVFGPADGVHPAPSTLYGAYKLACEGIGRAYAIDHGVASVGFRPLVVYGPGREVGSTAGATLACRHAVEGRPYAIPFTGETDMIFVDDVAAAFAAALLRPIKGAHVFNLRGEVASVDAIIAEIRKRAPGARLTAEGPPVPITSQIEAHDLAPVLGPLPTTSLAAGIERTMAFYQAAGRSAA
jgi:nucleoside-diphosphate-sugar epimerase